MDLALYCVYGVDRRSFTVNYQSFLERLHPDDRADLMAVVTHAVETGERYQTVFEPFWQAVSTYARAHGGLGLGLAIVRYLVEAHGGSVRAESLGEGQGTSFVVSLPAA
jgi:signal transduction histidine kinase